jgi:CRISPR-associated exonuclease Cas4
LEQQWLEDGATAEGRILHERVDAGGREQRGDVRTVRGMALRSAIHRLVGKADVVELHGRAPTWRPFPVEYKRGKPKAHRADEVQLCAQALCLEEMFGTSVPEGALLYGITRRRMAVAIDADLRSLTLTTLAQVCAMLSSGLTPAPIKMPACRRCSLEPLCRPNAIAARPAVGRWLTRQLDAALGE